MESVGLALGVEQAEPVLDAVVEAEAV